MSWSLSQEPWAHQWNETEDSPNELFPNIVQVCTLFYFQAVMSWANPNRAKQESNKKPLPRQKHSGTSRAEVTGPRKDLTEVRDAHCCSGQKKHET